VKVVDLSDSAANFANRDIKVLEVWFVGLIALPVACHLENERLFSGDFLCEAELSREYVVLDSLLPHIFDVDCGSLIATPIVATNQTTTDVDGFLFVLVSNLDFPL